MLTIVQDQKTMALALLKHLFNPLLSVFEELALKFAMGLLSAFLWVPAFLALDLFNTPELWWKGLAWMVLFDWLSGILAACKEDRFSMRVMVKKFYGIAGYVIACGATAVAANALPDALAWTQYVVYVSFIGNELYSVFRNLNLLSFIRSGLAFINQGKKALETFDNNQTPKP